MLNKTLITLAIGLMLSSQAMGLTLTFPDVDVGSAPAYLGPEITGPVASDEITFIDPECHASKYEFGDAPSPYPIAKHGNIKDQWLGKNVNEEEEPRLIDKYDDGVLWNPADVIPGQYFDLTFDATSTYETDVIVAIWIDWNQNSLWDDPGEQVVDWEGAVNDHHKKKYHRSVTQSIYVPEDAIPGETWMRARLNRAHSDNAEDMSPTAYQTYGECEDYPMQTIPEPATLSLIAFGGGLALLRRRRSRRVCASGLKAAQAFRCSH